MSATFGLRKAFGSGLRSFRTRVVDGDDIILVASAGVDLPILPLDRLADVDHLRLAPARLARPASTSMVMAGVLRPYRSRSASATSLATNRAVVGDPERAEVGDQAVDPGLGREGLDRLDDLARRLALGGASVSLPPLAM